MARQLGISRPTVYAYLRRDTPPGPRRLQRPPSARVLTPYLPYLIRRWRESGADSRQLWREIQALGYTHSARTVGRFITQLRRAADAGHPPESQRSPYTRPQGPSARAVSFAMVCPAAKRSREAQTYLDQLCQMDASIARAHAADPSLSGHGPGAPGRATWRRGWRRRPTAASRRWPASRGACRTTSRAITAGLTLRLE